MESAGATWMLLIGLASVPRSRGRGCARGIARNAAAHAQQLEQRIDRLDQRAELGKVKRLAGVADGQAWLLVHLHHDAVSTDGCGTEVFALSLPGMARAFAPPEGATFLRGEVAAIIEWRREDGDDSYHHLMQRDRWETVLPELVFGGG